MFVKILTVFLLLSPYLEAASFNTQNFRPSPDFGPYLSVMGSRTLDPGSFNLGFSIDHSTSPLSLFNIQEARTRDVIGNEVAVHFAGQAGILPRLDLGFIFSLVPSMEFRAPGVTSVSSVESQLGDMQLNTRVMLVNHSNHVLGMALVPFINLPTGSSDHFVGNGAVTGGGTLVVESKKIGQRLSLALNVGYEARPQTSLIAGTVVDDFIRYGAGANVVLFKPVDLIAEISGFTFTDSFFSSGQRPTEVEGALRIHLGDRLSFTLGGGKGILKGLGSPSSRFFAEVSYSSSGSGPKEEKVTRVIAPETEQEKFNEVVLQLNKNCPADPLQFDPTVHDAGCPKFYHFKEEMMKEEIVTLKGTEAEEKFSEVLLRLNKNCPADPSQFDPTVHDAGCPKFYYFKEEIAALAIPVAIPEPEPVYFGFNEVTLNQESAKVLREMVQTLKSHLEIKSLEVIGHADNVGTPSANERISYKRAEVVVKYLRGQGLPETIQLVPLGMGAKEPVMSNATPQGRRKNRRVILRIILP